MVLRPQAYDRAMFQGGHQTRGQGATKNNQAVEEKQEEKKKRSETRDTGWKSVGGR